MPDIYVAYLCTHIHCFNFTGIGVLPMRVFVHHTDAEPMEAKGSSDPLELDLQTTGSQTVGAGNQTARASAPNQCLSTRGLRVLT